jgi:two-component system, chemotaxis family, protein-glutamate methylesterase/glutaminase
MRRDLVVIGASAGGVDALRAIIGALPRDFSSAICVVVHTGPDSPGVLDAILRRAGRLEAVMVRSHEKLRPGIIYTPCPDRHLLVSPSKVLATKGPRENRFRPAVDPLFRSAAQAYGPRVIGVILSGGLDDGTAGLWAVKRMGGIAVVQDPQDALVESMPLHALQHVEVDHKLPAAGIAALLERLTREDIAEAGGYVVPESTKIEVSIANETSPIEAGVNRLGEPSRYACPECHGVLLELKESGRVRFRCHTGHAYSAESLLAEFDQAIENALGNSMRALQEKAIFLRDLVQGLGDESGALGELRRAAEEAQAKAEMLREATLKLVKAHANP